MEHKYSDPYNKLPETYPRQLQAEHAYYHQLSDRDVFTRYGETVASASGTQVGRNRVPTTAHGRVIENGIAAAKAVRLRANK